MGACGHSALRAAAGPGLSGVAVDGTNARGLDRLRRAGAADRPRRAYGRFVGSLGHRRLLSRAQPAGLDRLRDRTLPPSLT